MNNTVNYNGQKKRLEVFTSKRNFVFKKPGEQYVYKCHTQPTAAKNEAHFLRHLAASNVPVPVVRHCVGRVVVMRQLPGQPLPDWLCNTPTAPDITATARHLVGWLKAFYRAVNHPQTGEHRGDVNGRNFLIDGDIVWGVDFEERCHGTREADIGRLIAFVESYNNCDERVAAQLSKELAVHSVATLGVSPQLIETEKTKELAAMEKRRRNK